MLVFKENRMFVPEVSIEMRQVKSNLDTSADSGMSDLKVTLSGAM